MKKILFVLPFAMLLMSCGKVEDQLPSVSADAKTVKLTYSNCGMERDAGDTTEALTVSLDIEGSESKYEIEVGPNCYVHSEYDEFLVKKDGYIKSKSTYHVDRLIIDYMSKKGVNFKVFAGESESSSHESSVQTEYPGENDYGAVLEYPINGNSWSITNETDYKPAFYSVTVVFTM